MLTKKGISMIIYIDTGIFIGDFYLRGTNFVMLKNYLNVTDTTLVVSQVVIDELKNKYNEKLRLGIDDVNQAWNKINSMLENNVKINDEFIKENSELLWSNFNRFLENYNALCQDYPEVSHKEVVKRNLARKKPFGLKTKSEYRDYLIWLSFLDVAKTYDQCTICLITSNKADFSHCDPQGKNIDENKLHADYIEDLKENNIDIERIEYYCSLNSFIDSKVKPTLDKFASYAKVLEDYIESNKNNLRDNLEWKLFEFLINSEIDIDNFEIPYECENPYIESLSEIEDLHVSEVLRISKNQLYFQLDFSLYCNLIGYINKSDYYAMDDFETANIIVEDWEWNFFYMQIEIPSVYMHSSVEMIYDIEENDIISIG